MGISASSRLRLGSIAAAVVIVAGSFLAARPAFAESVPADPANPATPATVTADALPTPQIDGVVWTQTVVGTTVFVGGKFTTVRPYGSAAGVNTTAQAYLMSYNLTTGVWNSAFRPTLNAQVRAIVASADGSKIYASGSFTTVNGVTKNRVVELDATTGALVTAFNATPNYVVNALAIQGNTLFLGGAFASVGGATRGKVAAVNATTGAVLPFTATAAGGDVTSLAIAPDGSKLVVGGNFTTMNGSGNPGYGLAALDPVTGGLLPWAVNNLIRNGGANASITSLTADASGVYGSGYVFGAGGNIEGSFRTDWATGQLVWVEDCHGDTYSTAVTATAEYVAGHPHYCGNVGGFPQTSPTWTFHRGIAFSKAATQTVTNDPLGYYNYAGNPAPSLLNWYPDFNVGSYTGQQQGPWSVAASADSKYVVYGGEFTAVNNVKQQGLTRFAVTSVAPNKMGPLDSGSGFKPSLVSLAPGTVRVSWTSNRDPDSQTLTYSVYRDGNLTKPVYTTTGDSSVWNTPQLGFVDTGLAPGSSHSYRVRATDSFGNTAIGDGVTVMVTTRTQSTYTQTVLGQNPTSFWRLDESSGTAVYDWAGYSDQVAGSGVTRATSDGATGDGDGSSIFSGNGDGSGLSTTQTPIAGPQTFSVEAWIKTTTTAGGKIVGFGNLNNAVSNSFDRHLYMDTSGRVNFGVYPGYEAIVSSPTALNDGKWHQVIGTLGAGGQQLFVDGKRVGSNTAVTSAQAYSGYWRIGGDSSWSGANFFAGQIDDVSIYSGVLTRDQVDAQYTAAGYQSQLTVAPTDAYGKAVYSEQPDLYWRLGESTGTVAVDSGPSGQNGVYTGGVTQGTSGALRNNPDTAATFDGASGQVDSTTPVNDPENYSVEAWFKTTTTRGGKIIGFGSSQFGTSGSYDRHVYLQDDGRLVFGTYTGQTNTITSPNAYNDGQWHQVVASQSAQGLKLAVDGAPVASNPGVTQAQSYTGYWKVGGDTTWGSSSSYFAGDIDEVAVYDHPLADQTIAKHYSLGQAITPNAAPTSSFTVTTTGLSAAFDGTGSTDADGTVTSYAWDYGDGATDTTTGATPTHVYAASGTYTATLTVTDNGKATGVSTQQVVVVAPRINVAPTASFTPTTSGLAVTAVSASTDPDGTIVSTAWNFGDNQGAGSTASGTSVSHTYASAGTYTVSMTVTDNDGASSTASAQVTVAPINTPPTAAFTATPSGLTAALDGTTSTDKEGPIAAYAWDFGDGTAGSGATVSHTYPAANTYTVTLTVTDAGGLTNSTFTTVTVTAPPPPVAQPIALDTWNRTVTSGLGTADVGGAWTRIAGNASQLAVKGGSATFTTTGPGASVGAQLNSVAQTDVDLRTTVSMDKAATGGGTYVYVSGRKVSTNNEYRTTIRLRNNATAAVSLTAFQNSGGVTIAPEVVIPGTIPLGGGLNIRMQVTGTSPTTIRAKVWLAGTAEPTAWTVQATDSTPTVQAPGSIGLAVYDSGSSTNGAKVISFQQVSATKP